MATTYNVYFGEVGSMTLVSEGQASSEWELPDTLEYGTTYEWRIDSVNEYGTTYGAVWSFTCPVFAPPDDVTTVQRLVVAANDTIFYEDE